MTTISKTRRFAILDRDDFRCRYCGRTADTVVLHVDHIVPLAEGGTDDDDNLVPACVDCNLGKSDRLFDAAPFAFYCDGEEVRGRCSEVCGPYCASVGLVRVRGQRLL